VRNERGSAILVILSFLAFISVSILVSGRSIERLRVELNRIEQHQQTNLGIPD